MGKNTKTAAEIVQAARAKDKITATELIENLFTDFFELHGDRALEDDPAIIGGIGMFDGQPVTVIATDKGNTPQERALKHFGCPTPAGYRKARRLMKQAEKFRRPVITFVNTAGAYPGAQAEEEGQGYSIAQNLMTMSELKTPLITVITGEGGSGGALALAGGDSVWMLEDSMYSVLSPEGFASILWKDSSRADEAAEVLQLSPTKLLEQNVIEGIIPESQDHQETCQAIKKVLQKEIARLQKMSLDALCQARIERFSQF